LKSSKGPATEASPAQRLSCGHENGGEGDQDERRRRSAVLSKVARTGVTRTSLAGHTGKGRSQLGNSRDQEGCSSRKGGESPPMEDSVKEANVWKKVIPERKRMSWQKGTRKISKGKQDGYKKADILTLSFTIF